MKCFQLFTFQSQLLMVGKDEMRRCGMNYKEAVERKIDAEMCKELWREIATGYEQSGEDGINSVLVKNADEIVNKFRELLNQLRKKL